MKFFIEIYFKGLYYFLTNRNYRLFFWYSLKFSKSIKNSLKIVKLGKYKFQVVDAKSFVWQFYEIFFREFYFFKSNKEEPLIIDCGSNIGLSLLYYKIAYPNSKVVGFEPDPKIFKTLKFNMENNNLQNVLLKNNAVWIKNENLFFNSDGADGGSISHNSFQNEKVIGVDFKEELGKYKSIDFLKIDIEGAEVDLLNHCRNSLDNVTNIFIEYHSFKGENQNLHQILEILSENKFRYYIDSPSKSMKPLYPKIRNKMDMQINIFATKVE